MQRMTLQGVTMGNYNETAARYECALLYDVPAELVDLYATADLSELTVALQSAAPPASLAPPLTSSPQMFSTGQLETRINT
jgi:hypothetical protein